MAYSNPCANNCGLFGSPENHNLCSNCFQRQQAISIILHTTPRRPSPSIVVSIPVTDGSPSCASSDDTSVPIIFTLSASDPHDQQTSASSNSPAVDVDADAVAAAAAAKKTKPTRCQSCHKKMGLSGIRCRCGLVFCGLHRFPDQHSCSFDFKALDRAALAKANPFIEAPKIHKI